jgi:hypothetical protein
MGDAVVACDNQTRGQSGYITSRKLIGQGSRFHSKRSIKQSTTGARLSPTSIGRGFAGT